MVRIRIPNGLLLRRQLRTIADSLPSHARGVADITVRQNIQLHWVTHRDRCPSCSISSMRVGLTTTGACGDVARAVTGCPLAGLDADEIYDASPIALATRPPFRREQRRVLQPAAQIQDLRHRLPRRGAPIRRSMTLALPALLRKRLSGHDERGFSARVGGGLSTEPHLAMRLNAFVRPEPGVAGGQVAIAEIFRACRRASPKPRAGAPEVPVSEARLRLPTAFSPRLNRAASVPNSIRPRKKILPPISIAITPASTRRSSPDISMSVPRPARPHYPEQLRIAAATLAERFAGGQMRTTIMQNLLLVNIPEQNADRPRAANCECRRVACRWISVLARHRRMHRHRVLQAGDSPRPKALRAGWSRNWTNVCPGFDQQLKLNITGCPNSCGQHWIADLGIEGKKIKVDGRCRTPITSAWAARWAGSSPSRVRSDIAAWPRRFRTRSSGC